jgi:hypothetical protein
MLVFRLVRILTLVMVTATLGASQVASAANFDGVGNHTLTSSNLGFSVPSLGWGMSCASSIFEVNVAATGATATVTAATFDGCVGTGLLSAPAVGTATNFPWEITTSGVPGQFTIDGIHITFDFPSIGVSWTFEGNLEGTYNNTTNTATFASSTGLTATTSLGNGPALVTGTLADDQHTLRVT